MTAPPAGRCPWTIHWGVSQEQTTQCDLPEHVWEVRITPAGTGFTVDYLGDPHHSGPSGVRQGQVITWQAGDRREYTGLWPGPCPFPACTLHAGHHGRHAP